MSSARARANHKLYLARIVLTAWQGALAAQNIPAKTLSQAYAGAVREHLAQAYGWFLLEIAQPSALPDRPPRTCADLPSVAEGKAIPGEIREFAQLESGGWIAEMLVEPDVWSGTGAGRGAAAPNLVIEASAVPGPDIYGRWADRLESLFDRMSDSLDEY